MKIRSAMRILILVAIMLATAACAHKKPAGVVGMAVPPASTDVTGTEALAAQVDRAHQPPFEMDFFRVGFVAEGTTVDHVARPGALRSFVGSSSYFSPPMALAKMVTYPGLADAPDRELVAMRCKPATPEAVDPILATWPNIFHAIRSDLAARDFACPAKPGAEPGNRAYCIAHSYHNSGSANVTLALAQALQAAAQFYPAGDRAMDTWLVQNYGIYPAFSGLGLSVKDSYNLDDKHPLTAGVILQNSITPEYLLRNVSLAEAGCRCIRVSPYPQRSTDPIDPEFVWQKGGEGICIKVERLASAAK